MPARPPLPHGRLAHGGPSPDQAHGVIACFSPELHIVEAVPGLAKSGELVAVMVVGW